MKVAVNQMDIVAGEPSCNREKGEKLIKQGKKEEQPDIIVLPEMWTTAYMLPQLEQVADRNGEPTLSFLKKQAKNYHVHIIGGSVANQREGQFYNTALVVDSEGRLIVQYDKIH